jgi:hypothetical protein
MNSLAGGFLLYVYRSVHGVNIYQHRFVMEQHLGRPLTSDEHVHHLNGKTADNRIENLEIMSRREHHQHHAAEYERDELCRFTQRTVRRASTRAKRSS